MRLFKCQACEQLLYFENTRCERCGHTLGYLPEINQLSALEPEGEAGSGNTWRALAQGGQSYRFCANAAHEACNWLVPAGSAEPFCTACRHNGTVPDLTIPENLALWQVMERAKHRLFYTLIKLKLPLETQDERPMGLRFDFLADSPAPSGPKVMTGHEDGLITIALAEADDAERETRRKAMGEPYRTLLGHFRHEVAHYYWDRIVDGEGHLDACRAVFGDDRQDYGEALKIHYEQGAPADWQDNFISTYATTHPWEDFAETWAHYLHIIDTLEMARAFGVHVDPKIDRTGELEADIDFSPYKTGDIDRIIEGWLPLSFALNSLNRCLGQSDLYPFIISPPVVAKLGFIHDLVHAEHKRPG